MTRRVGRWARALGLTSVGWLAGGASAAEAPSMAPFLARDIQVDTLHVRYAVFLPQGYDASKPWPCIVFLHGQGESGRDVAAVTRIGMGAALRRSPERWPCIVLLPQKPRTDEEWEEHEDLVLAVLRDASSQWAIDPRRVALAGMSQGGHGTW